MNKIYWFIFLIFLFSKSLFSVQKGSESNVTIEPLAIFPSVDTDNRMMGFGWFKNGFVLEDSLTSCTFDSVFPVSGSVVLSGGTLYLNSDLHLANITTITSVGTIDGQGHIFKIDSSVERLFNSNNDIFLKDIDVFLHSDLQFSTTVRFDGNCYLNGRDRRVNLDDDIEVLVGPNSTLHIKNINIVGVSRSKIRCIDNTGKIILDNASLVLDGNYNFTVGDVEVLNYTDVSGSYTFFYDCFQTLTINSNSIFKFRDGITLAIGTKNTLSKERIFYFEDQSSRLWIENGNVHSGPSGILATRGSLVLAGRIDIDIDSTDTTNGVILGDGTQKGDFLAEFTPASHINFKNGHVIYNEYDPAKFISKSTYSKLIRGETNVFHIERDQLFSNVTIKVDPASELTVTDGAQVNYDNCKMIMPGVKFSITGSRYNTYTSLLDGNEEIFLEEGSLPLYFLIANAGNLIRGNGNLTGIITLQDSDAELRFNLDGHIQNNIVLNGGKIILLDDLEFSLDKYPLGEGEINLSYNDLILGSQDLNWTSTIYFDGSNGTIELNSKTCLSSKWTFSGDCKINGNLQNLNLDTTGQIVVERGSTLRLKDLKILSLSENQIKCLDDNSKIVLDNVSLVQDGDFSFTAGKLEILNNVEFIGTSTFFYDCLQTLTIDNDSTLKFSNGMTFAIGVNESLAKDRIVYFSDSTSCACFENANFHIGSSGIIATKGKMIFSGNVNVDTDSTDTTNGVILGDGTPGGDIIAEFYPASYINFRNGHLVYNEYDPSRFVSKSTYSRLVRGETNTFHIKRDQIFKNVTISVAENSALTVADGTEVHYENCKMALPGVKFEITGSRYNTYTSLLDGDEEIFLQEGTLPLYTVVKNSGNLISGNGNISGGITLYDDNAELGFSLNGNLENNITFLLGGNVILLNDIRFIKDKNFVGAGTVDLNDSVLSFGSMDQNLTSSIYFDGNSCGCLEMNSDLSLYSSWTFSGNCQIKGNNNIIIMRPTGQIIVERGSTLEFKDIRIAELSGTNIKCLDDSGKIIFDGVQTKQGGDYSFENGSLEVDYFFDVKGEYTFSYKSTQQSTVKRCALWSFFPGTTFSYCPANNSNNLINLFSEESELCFDDSTLHSTTTGLNLTKGVLNIHGNCLLKSDATSKSEGIVFGDGVLQDNDLKINVYPESILELVSGYLVYKNLG